MDGSWHNKNGINKAGVGGYIKNNTGELIFIFSGPSLATTLLMAETHALVYMIENISSRINKSNKVLIHTDSYTLWDTVIKFRTGLTTTSLVGLYNLIKDNGHIKIEYINRLYTVGADDLAKQGSTKPSMVMGWL